MSTWTTYPKDAGLKSRSLGTTPEPIRASNDLCLTSGRNGNTPSNFAVFLTIAASACLLAGCAQTAWMRPETSTAETQIAQNQCNYEADLGTPASDIHLRGRHSFAKALAEGVLGAVQEGIHKAGLMSSCMIASGFHQEIVQSAPTIQIASAYGLPPVQPIGGRLDSRVGNSTPKFEPGQYIVLTPPNLRPSDMNGPGLLGGTDRLARRPLWPAYEAGPRVLPVQATAWVVDQRQLLTQQFMNLPDASMIKISFMRGACSAGDETACIMSEAVAPVTKKATSP